MCMMDSHVRDQRVCMMSGADAARFRKRILNLRELEKFLLEAIVQAEKGVSDYRMWKNAELGARVVKLVADTALHITGTLVGKVNPWEATAIEKTYSTANIMVDSVAGNVDAKYAIKMLIDNKVKIVELAASEMAGEKVGGAIGHTKHLIDQGIALHETIASRTEDRAPSGKGSLLSQLKRIRQKISDLDAALSACDVDPEFNLT